MSNYTPQNPDAIETYDALLKEYNTVFGKNYKFYFDYDYPSKIDFHVYSECTTDGYEVWVMKSCDESTYLTENVYYNEPGVDDLFNELNCFDPDETPYLLIHCELDFSDVEYYIREELEQNYYNYQRELEDAE
jgi:hypothetical protein